MSEIVRSSKSGYYYLRLPCDILCQHTSLSIGSSSDELADALTRMMCECGVPKLMMMDRQTGLMKMVENIDYFLSDVQGKLSYNYGMKTNLCPVQGHNFPGKVERIGGIFQETLRASGCDKLRLDPLTWQTMAKLFDNMFNSQPIALRENRSDSETLAKRVLTPNMLRFGHNNQRMLVGPVRLVGDPAVLCDVIY